jgi:hypothetical protein
MAAMLDSSEFLFFRHVWVLFIVTTIINALIFRARSERYLCDDPSLEDGYRKLFWGSLISGIIPYAIMGLGCMVGGVPSVFHYINPLDRNPFITAFWALMLLEWVLGTYWLFAWGGAEMIIRHPGLYTRRCHTPAMLKLIWCIATAGVIVWWMIVTQVPGLLLPATGP